MSGSDWSTPELVRAVEALVASVDKLQRETAAAIKGVEDTLTEKYVSKELLAARLAPFTDHRNEVKGWVREIVAPVLVALVVVLATRWIHP